VLAKGASIVDVELLEPAVWLLAGLSVITVGQRIFHVRRELTRPAVL
jgi:CDP-diacylglycerol--glycerol-3-phosphate 3-phosphatidyltransferase